MEERKNERERETERMDEQKVVTKRKRAQLTDYSIFKER